MLLVGVFSNVYDTGSPVVTEASGTRLVEVAMSGWDGLASSWTDGGMTSGED